MTTTWPEVALGDVAEVVSGATPKTSVADYWGGDICWVTPKDLSELGTARIADTPRKLTAAGLASCGATVLPPDSVLLSSRAPIGLVAVNAVPMATNQGFKSLVPRRDRLDHGYLYWWLRANRSRLESLGRGVTFKEISKGITEAVRLPLPPIEEQRRIAAVLDQADQVRAKRQRSAALVESLAHACFVDAFGDSASELPTVPLGSLVVAGDRINYGVVQPGDEHAGGVALVRVSDLVGGMVSHAKLKRITLEIEANYRRSRLFGDEILISCVGSVGVVALSSERERGFNIARAVARIRLAPSLSREYVAAYLSTPPIQAVLRSELRTVAQPTLNIKQLAELPIPIPHADSQARFERRIQAVRSVVRRAADHLSGLDSLFASLQQRAFAGAL